MLGLTSCRGRRNDTGNQPQLTIEDYVNSRYVLNPLRLWDCDRPVNASAAYLFMTAERARDMRQPPVYVLNHSQHNFRQRTTQADLDEIEDWTDRAARRMYEGAGLGLCAIDQLPILTPFIDVHPLRSISKFARGWGQNSAPMEGQITVPNAHLAHGP